MRKKPRRVSPPERRKKVEYFFDRSQPGSSKIAISIGRITDRREHYHNPNVTAAELTESVIHID